MECICRTRHCRDTTSGYKVPLLACCSCNAGQPDDEGGGGDDHADDHDDHADDHDNDHADHGDHDDHDGNR